MNSPTADVSVRVAWADDAPGIASVQVRAWQSSYAELLPAEVLAELTADELARIWHESMTRPKDARNRVLVALERNRITGFASTMPSQDPDGDQVADGDIVEFSVDPDELGKGHGSRLLQACADTLRADKFHRATFWVNADADQLRAFLEGAGWAPDGAHRELDLRGDGTVTVKQVRLHTAL
ncbi:GCN5 family acetyltransferase [Nocardioides sp. Soil797]|nr:GCN5 family acetyltransferase [Nocardioides sp. Soil797]